MRLWPRKPEPVLNWRLVWMEMICAYCEAKFRIEAEEIAPMLNSGPAFCPACRFVDSLPYSVQDRYLNELEYDLDA